MFIGQNKPKSRIIVRTICLILIVTFGLANISPVQAQGFSVSQLPMPGAMVAVSPPFAPLALKGMVVDPDKPLELQFIVDTGHGPQDSASVKEDINQLAKYFLAGITLPEGDLWVNLSPYEKDRIAPASLSETDLGRDLLAQDYTLKQLTASLLYPEKDLGKKFWDRVYKKAQKQFGTTNIPVNTFNRVWILPKEAEIFEKNNAAYVTKATLKVMLDEDYLAKQKGQDTQASSISSQIVREIVLPEIEKEVNTGKNFAQLRQIYQTLILAKWYKETIQNGLMDTLYTDKKKVSGVNVDDPSVKEKIYQRYLDAYKKGAFNFIKEDYDPISQEVIPRKYFSGGITQMGTFVLQRTHDDAKLTQNMKTDGELLDATINLDIQSDMPVHYQAPVIKKLSAKNQKEIDAMVEAGGRGDVQEVRVALRSGLNINGRDSKTGRTVLMAASANGRINVVKEILFNREEEEKKPSVQVENIINRPKQEELKIAASSPITGIYQFVKNKFGKKKKAGQEVTSVDRSVPAIVQPIRRPQTRVEPRDNGQTSGRQLIRQPPESWNYQHPQSDSNLPSDFRQELERQIQRLGNAVAESSKMTLIRSFRPTGPGELPLPVPISMLNEDTTDRDRVIHILENMQRMMDGTDEKVLRDFERAVDNARDSVTQQSLNRFDNLSDDQVVELLTNGYIEELQREFERIFEDQVQHMIRFYTPSYQEQNLYVSEEINEKYPRLPRYLKWILTNNPDLENDYYVREWLNMIQNRVNQIPPFPDMITGYSKAALTKSLYLNPQLAMRVLLFLAKNTSRGYASAGDIERQIQQELAKSFSDNRIIDGEIDINEAGEAQLALEAPSQVLTLPGPDVDETEAQVIRLKELNDEYVQFEIKFREHLNSARKAEVDLKELSEGLEEARRQNDRVIIDALQPAVDGLNSKLHRLNEKTSRLNEEKIRYEEQINALRSHLGSGTNLYSINPFVLGVAGVFTVMFGIPLYITKKILNKWYNTTAGKVLGMGASIGSLAAGYYLYLGNLSPEIEKFLHAPSSLNPTLATFFIIWPVAILSGIWGGRIGKGVSFENLYNRANKAFGNENYEEAINLINSALKLKPKNVNAKILLAESQRKLRHFKAAIEMYEKIIKTVPHNSVVYNNLGVVYEEDNNRAKAIETYKRSLEINPNDRKVLNNLATALEGDGLLLEAAKVYQRHQQVRPTPEVTEKLNHILRQIGQPEQVRQPAKLQFFKTMRQVVLVRSKWIGSFYEVIFDDDMIGGILFVGALLGAGFGWLTTHFHWWQMGTEQASTATKWTVWLSSIGGGAFLLTGAAYVVGTIYDFFASIFRFVAFPSTFLKIQDVNLKPSDQLSDKEIAEAAPIYARMSKDHLESIFKSWVEAEQEEKVGRLFKFGKWDSDKTKMYADVGEYKRVSRLAASKFATIIRDQKGIIDRIDTEKERLSQKGIANPLRLMNGIISMITENTRSREEFFYWLTQIVDLPEHTLKQGQRQVSTVFTDLREYEQAKADAFKKFGPKTNPKENAAVNSKINELVQKLKKDGLTNFPAVLKKVLAEINNVSRTTDEFVFWINEILRFDKQWFSSGNYMTLLQNLIAYERAKQQAFKNFVKTKKQENQINQALNTLREDVRKKQPKGEVEILKDVLPRVIEVSNTFDEFLGYIEVLKDFDKKAWSATLSVLTALNNHVAYKQARERAASKFTAEPDNRKKFLNDIDALRAKLVDKGFPHASDLLKDILPELTKTSRTKDEFIFWLGELVGLNESIWQRGSKAVINNFNDLAGFKQAKEMAVEKLASTQMEKTELTQYIDALKAKLEAKVPSSAGLLKDVILKILEDINVLANPPNFRNNFMWYLGKTVDFEKQTWTAGTAPVLAGYQEIKEYIKQKLSLVSKFTTTEDEKKRLISAWNALDKSPNFAKPSFVSLLNKTLGKISAFAKNPREFVFWIGTLSELDTEVIEVFLRDIDTVFAYYKEKGKTRDFNHLPAVLNQYHKTYHHTVLITPNLLDILTDPAAQINKRIENASNYIVEQRIVKLGAPPNLIGLRDAVSFDQLLDNPEIGESGFRDMLGNQSIRQAVSKMGAKGLYTYWETQKPAYYQEFLDEGKGLAPGFNRPGEKFRVDYDGTAITLTTEEEKDVKPMLDNVEELKLLIQYLRLEWPNLYDNFTKPKRELIKGRHLEEFITKESARKVAGQLLSKAPGWQSFSEQQKAVFIIKLMQILAFPDTAESRAKIASATDSFERLRETAAYWDKVWQYVQKQKFLSQKLKYYAPLVKSIRQKISVLNDKLVDVGNGVLRFYLTGHTMADFFRGSISRECTAYGGLKFDESIGQITDPAFFLFKVMEEGKWVGNVYSVAAKTDDGKFALFLDWFKLDRTHPLVANDSWDERRKKFMKVFFTQLRSYLASQGFDYLIVTKAPSETSYKLYEFTQDEAKAQANNSNTVSTTLKKLGGTGYLKESSLSEEFLQNFGSPGSSHSVDGYKITLDKSTPQVFQKKQGDLEYLEKLLGEMSSEEMRLASLSKEKEKELKQIIKIGQEAANSGKQTMTLVLKDASEQKTVEIQKIQYELGELQIRIREKRNEFSHLAVELGLEPEAAVGASDGTKLYSSSPLTFLSGLFGRQIDALSRVSWDDLSPLLWIGGLAGFFGLFYYILKKFFPPETDDRGSYYERSYVPGPRLTEFKLPAELQSQQDQIIAKVSPENRGLIPTRIDVQIPYAIGISRLQALKALGLLYSKLIEHASILDFFKDKDFYLKFKQRAKEFGLADDFDNPTGKNYFFTVPKEEVRYAEDRRSEEFVRQYLDKLTKSKESAQELSDQMRRQKARLLRGGWLRNISSAEVYSYYLSLLQYTAIQSEVKLQAIDKLLKEKNYLVALSTLEEFYRIDIGGEQIALEKDAFIRDELNRILRKELEDIHWQFNRSSDYQAKKQQVVHEAKDIQFELRLSPRTVDDILRGVASGDCTSIVGSAYYNTIPQFMFDPGFLAFKVMQESKWVGNIYAIVSEKSGKPVLIVDAVQLPVWGRSWPVSVKGLSDRALEKVVEYAKAQGFDEVLMSSFVSNFNAIHDHFGSKYPTTAQEVKKIGGFEHLKALGLWDNSAIRNEYIESYSPQWNYPLKKVDSNNSEQTLMLRSIWKSSAAQLADEIKAGSSPISGQTVTSKPRRILRRFIMVVMIAIPLLFFAAHSANGATFSHNPNGTVGVTVEKNDTFGQILLDAGYKSPLWGPSGNVAKLSAGVQNQIRSGDVNLIYPNEQFNIPVNEKVNPPEASLDTQKTIDKINDQLKTAQDQLETLRQTHSNLAGENSDLKASLAQAQQQIDQLKTTQQLPDEVTQLENKKTDLERRLTDLQKQQEQAQAEIKRVLSEKERVSDEVNSLGKEIPALQKQVETLNDQIKEFDTQREQIQAQVVKLQTQEDTLQESVEQLTRDKDALDQQLKDLKQKVDQTQKVLEDAETKSKPSWKNVISSFSWQQQLGLFLLALTGIGIIISGVVLWKKWMKFKNVQDRVVDLQREADELQIKLEPMRQEKEDLTQDIEAKREQAAQLDQQKQDRRMEARELSEQIEQLRAQRQDIQEETTRAQEEKGSVIAELETTITDLNREITEKKDRLTALAEQQPAVVALPPEETKPPISGESELTESERVKAEEETATKLNKEIIALRQSIETLTQEEKQKSGELEQNIADLTGRKEGLEGQITQLETELETKQQGIVQQEQRSDVLKEEIFGHEKTVADLKEQVQNRQNELRGLEKQKAMAQRQLEVLQDTSKATAEIEALREQLQEIQDNIITADEELVALNAKKAQLEEETAGLKAQQQEVETKKDELAQLEQQKETLQQENAGLESQRTTLRQDVNRKQEELDGLQRRLRAVQTALEEQAQASEQILSGQRTEIQTQEVKKQSLQEQIDTLDQDFKKKKQEALEILVKLDEEKKKIESELEALMEQGNARKEELEGLHAAVSTLKEEKTTLQQDVDGLKLKEKILKNNIETLKERERILTKETKSPEKIEKLTTEVKEFVEEAVSINEEVNRLLGVVGTPENTEIYSVVTQQIRNILEGQVFNIQTDEFKSQKEEGRNIIITIPATRGMENVPKIILNSHIDVWSHGYGVVYKGQRTQTLSGALDDRSGVVAILSGLGLIKERLLKSGKSHGPINIIFTDFEEKGGQPGSRHLVDNYKSGKKVAKDLFDNTGVILTLDGPLLWGGDNDRRHLSQEELKNPFVIAKIFNLDQESKEYYDAVYNAVSSVNFKRFLEPRYPDSDGPGDHRNFAEILDKKLNRRIPVINLRAPYIDVDSNGVFDWHTKNERVDIENELVPVAKWVSEIVVKLTDNLTRSLRKTSGIVISSSDENKGPTPLWEYRIVNGKVDPVTSQFGMLPSQVESDLNEVLEDLSGPTQQYPDEVIKKIKTIRIVAGNSRLAEVNSIDGEIDLDIKAFANKKLLLMEFDHELLHLGIHHDREIHEIGDKVLEEFVILSMEVSRFLRLLYQEDQEEILNILQNEENLDDKGFYLVLKNALEQKESTSFLQEIDQERWNLIFEDILNYMRKPGVYSVTFQEYLKGKTVKDLFRDVDHHRYYHWFSNEWLIRKLGFHLLPLLFSTIFYNLGDYKDMYPGITYAKYLAKCYKHYGIKFLAVLKTFIESHSYRISKVDWSAPDSLKEYLFRATIALLLERINTKDSLLMLADLIKTTPDVLIFSRSDLETNKIKVLVEEYNEIINKLYDKEWAVSEAQTDLKELNEGLEEAKKINDQVIIEALLPAVDILTSKIENLNEKMKSLNQERDRYESLINAIQDELDKAGSANSPKGKGVFSSADHLDINEIVAQAQKEGRGQLIWGNIAGWPDNQAKYSQDVGWVIASLKRYSMAKIPKLGEIDIPEILAQSNIILIAPQANSPPGLLAKSKDSYQIAHNGQAQNSIYIDQYTYEQLQTFEVAVLLAHEAILLGAKKLAARKGVPWTEQLARKVIQIAEDYEINIVGRSDKGNGSRFDDRIVEILGFNKPSIAQPNPSVKRDHVVEIPPEKPAAYTPPPQPKMQPKLQPKPQESNGKFNLDFPDVKDDALDGLRQLFLDSMFRDATASFPVQWEGFPPPLAQEIKSAYDLGKIKGIPLDPDFLTVLTAFFSRIFPNHTNSLINYLRTLHIFIIDNGRSTFGATLQGDTFYIQRSLFEDLLRRPITVDEIKRHIKDKDKQFSVALFRIIIHEIGSAFFKTSHRANQDLEKLFLGLLSKTTVTLPYNTQEEFRRTNNTVDLNSLARLDWAEKETLSFEPVQIALTGADMSGLIKGIGLKLTNSLYSPHQTFRNNAAEALDDFKSVEALPFLRLLKKKEPDNKIVARAVRDLESYAGSSGSTVDINAADNDGNTALSLARLNDHEDIADLLKTAGADEIAVKTPKEDKGEKGGIDLNQINIQRTGTTIQIQFDQTQLNEIIQSGFQGFTPVIINVMPIPSPLPLLGINTLDKQDVMAKNTQNNQLSDWVKEDIK